MGLMENLEAATEEVTSSKLNQVREMLKEMGLPFEVIEHAVKNFHENGGDLNEIATYALNFNIPQVECIEEHLSDDMISSDEDACAEREECKSLQLPSRTQCSSTEAPKAPEEKLQDSTCKHFEEPITIVRPLLIVKAEASSSHQLLKGKSIAVESTSIVGSRLIGTADTDSSDQFRKGKSIKEEIEPPEIPEPSQPSEQREISFEQRETSFLDMGFPRDLVQRAIRHHGVDAADSILVQFILDYSENSAQRAQLINEKTAQITDEEESDSEEEARIRENIAARLHIPTTSTRPSEANEANEATANEDSDSSESDSDDPPCDDWEAEAPNSSKPSSLRSKGIPQNDLRALMLSQGFPPDSVDRAIQELGAGVDYAMLLDHLLHLSDPQESHPSSSSLRYNKKVSTLEKLTTEFQFPSSAVEKAMDICKTPAWDASEGEISDVVDFLDAHMENLTEGWAPQEEGNIFVSEYDSDEDDGSEDGVEEDVDDDSWGREVGTSSLGKRKLEELEKGKTLVRRGRPPKRGGFTGGLLKKSKPSRPMVKISNKLYRGAVGFGLPGQPVKPRKLREDVKGAPFFYFENVAGMPQGEWQRIQTHLYDIEPEFVDAMHFSACRRARGYIHNLPLEGRRKLIKDPPMTIQEVMPQTKAFWPKWDKRDKLNCINTIKASEFLSKRLGIEDGSSFHNKRLTEEEIKTVKKWCSKLNLVWTSPHIPSPIEANEIEALLGFDKDHSRSCFSQTDRYKALGNTFSVYTVAYHFSTLKPLYKNGIKVLSLFTGIGGAEVALHKIGIKLSVVVSVEIEKGSRRCLKTWWDVTEQKGKLDMTYHDVKMLKTNVLVELVEKYRGFDLVVGGSPCNNLTSNNRHTRTGLEGEHSNMFFEFTRIVTTVRDLTIKLQEREREMGRM